MLLHSEEGQCAHVWFAWLVASRSRLFRAALHAQNWVHLPEVTQQWHQHVVEEESEAGSAVQSKFYLPSQVPACWRCTAPLTHARCRALCS